MIDLPLWIPAAVVGILLLLLLARSLFSARKSPRRAKSAATSADTESRSSLTISSAIARIGEEHSLTLLLEILRHALNGRCVLLLEQTENGEQLRLLDAACPQSELRKEPIVRGSGFLGSLHAECPEIVLCPVPGNLHIPYHTTACHPGALLALLLCEPKAAAGNNGASPHTRTFILVLERDEEQPWSHEDRELIALCAEQLRRELGRVHAARHAPQRRPVSAAQPRPTLTKPADPFAVLIEMAEEISQADFLALSMREQAAHRIVKAGGPKAEHFEGLEFPLDDGLVGHVINHGQELIILQEERDGFPVFSDEMRMTGIGSLHILPLLEPGGGAIGALTVAGRMENMFDEEQQRRLRALAGRIIRQLRTTGR